MTSPQEKICFTSQGFSLIEVTMAIGIVSFCLLTVMALLSVGSSTLKQAVDQTVESQIAQKLAGEILLTPYSQLTKYAGTNIYFDDAGSAVAAVLDPRYKVQIFLTNPNYPGSANAPANTPITNSMQTVQMNIVKMPGDSASNRYTVQVPNSGN
jgi:hypothetical protein